MGKLSKTKKDIEGLSGSKRERAERLLDKAEFMDAELVKLQEIIKKKGWAEVYTNGATQSGIKKCTEGDVYNTLIKNYSSVMKQLEEMLKDSTGEDELEAFLK